MDPFNNTGQVTVYVMDTGGGGFADNITVPIGTTLKQFVQDRLGAQGRDVNAYTIMHNDRQGVGDRVLADNDSISLTPAKVAGA